MRTSLLCCFIMILGAVGTCKAGSASSAGTSVKLSVLGGRPVVNGVFLSGQGPFRFLLDTGAETNQLDATIARKLRLTPVFRVEMATAAGTMSVGGARLPEVTLGTARAVDQEFLFTTLDGVHELGEGIQGVLGQEFLGRFDYLLNLRAGILDFGAPEPAGDHIATERLAGRMAIATSHGHLVLDSGSDTLLLFCNPAGAATGRIRTASGFAAVEDGKNVRIRIGNREYKPERSARVSRPEVAEDGLLPVSLFRVVYISNSGGYIVMDPAMK